MVDSILKKRPHKIEEQLVEVHIYNEVIGVIPLDHDTSKPAASIPPDIDITIMPPSILQFWLKSKQTQQKLEKKLEEHHCIVDWPAEPSNPLRLSFMQDKDLSDIHYLAMNWGNIIKEVVSNMRDEFESKSIQPLQQAWKPFLEKIGDLTPGDRELLDISIDSNQCEVLLVGIEKDVMCKYDHLTDVLKDVMDAMNREAKCTTETIKSLSPPQLKLLLAHKIPNMIKSKFPHLEYTIEDDQLVIRGMPDDIMKAKLETFEFVQNPSVRSIEISPSMKRLLGYNIVQDAFAKRMREQKVNVSWEISHGCMKLYSVASDDVERGAAIFKDCLLEKQISVSSKSSRVLLGNGWQQFENEVNCNKLRFVCVESKEEGETVVVVATREAFNETVEKVRQFLKDNTVTGDWMVLSYGLAKFLDKHMQKEFEDVRQSAVELVKLEMVLSTDECEHGIQIEGTSTATRSAKNRLEALTRKVQMMKYPITKTGMEKVFVTKGPRFIQTLEAQVRATIEIVQSHKQSPIEESIEEDGSRVQVKSKTQFEGATIMVVTGDLPSYQADAIVNAANQELKHFGGLAKAIVTAGEFS